MNKLRRMAESDLVVRIAYDGDALQDGSMDVRELAPALLALGDLLQGANRVLNGDRAALAVKVRSDFKTGSFDFGMALTSAMGILATLLHTAPIATAKEIAEYVGLITGADINLLRFLKWLRGRK